MSVMASLCSSKTSDRVMLLPLLGTSNTSTEPDETPEKKVWEMETAHLVYTLGKYRNSYLKIYLFRYLLYIHCWQMKPLTYTYVFFPHRCNPSGKHCFSWEITTNYLSFMRYESHRSFLKLSGNEERKRITQFTSFTEVCTDLWVSLVCPGHANRP